MKQRDIIKFEVLQRKFKNMVKERGERTGTVGGTGGQDDSEVSDCVRVHGCVIY